MRKLSIVLVVAAACLTCFAAAASGKPAPSRLTIESVPSGAFGNVSSPRAACAEGRQVVLFEMRGDERDPARDRRIGSDRAAESEDSLLWSVETRRTGSFYARAKATKGCAAALSRVLPVAARVAGEEGSDSPYPPCGPYVSEGPSLICKFTEMYLDLDQEGPLRPCRFGDSSGGCPGRATGLFPWGRTGAGDRPRVQISWRPGDRVRILEVASEGSAGRLDGTIPNAGSDRFTVTNAFARNENGGGNGDNFFTPNLPGQGPGEVGGPLKLNFQNGRGTDFGAQAWISGYLFLKH